MSYKNSNQCSCKSTKPAPEKLRPIYAVLNAEELIRNICDDFTEDEVFDFIVGLEEAYSSVELAQRLREHFEDDDNVFGLLHEDELEHEDELKQGDVNDLDNYVQERWPSSVEEKYENPLKLSDLLAPPIESIEGRYSESQARRRRKIRKIRGR